MVGGGGEGEAAAGVDETLLPRPLPKGAWDLLEDVGGNDTGVVAAAWAAEQLVPAISPESEELLRAGTLLAGEAGIFTSFFISE